MDRQKRGGAGLVHRWRTTVGAGLLLVSADIALAGAGGRFSLSVQDADVRTVLHQLADAARLNLVLGEGVRGQLSLRVSGQPPLAVLEGILRARGLGSERAGDTLWVAPLEELTSRARQARDWRQAREAGEPVRTELLALQHARAGEIVRLAAEAGAGERLLGPRGRMEVDVRTNTLLLTDTEARRARWREWLTLLDRPGRQVVIETRLAALSRTRARTLGARWRLQVPGVSAQVPLTAAGEAATLAYGLLAIDGHALDLELSALESEGGGEVIARPSVMAAEQQTARIASGQQIPYQETTHSGASTTRFVNAELSLEVTPTITADGQIQLDVRLSHDSPGEIQPSGARAIDTNRLATQVRLRDGQTLVLGGIFRTQTANSVSKVPGLGNIPLLGSLFSRRQAREDKQELLIFVTPRLAAEAVSVGPPAAEMADG